MAIYPLEYCGIDSFKSHLGCLFGMKGQGQYRNGRVISNIFGNASLKELAQASVAMIARHDQVGVFVPGNI